MTDECKEKTFAATYEVGASTATEAMLQAEAGSRAFEEIRGIITAGLREVERRTHDADAWQRLLNLCAPLGAMETIWGRFLGAFEAAPAWRAFTPENIAERMRKMVDILEGYCCDCGAGGGQEHKPGCRRWRDPNMSPPRGTA